jgi:hypothetical protein
VVDICYKKPKKGDNFIVREEEVGFNSISFFFWSYKSFSLVIEILFFNFIFQNYIHKKLSLKIYFILFSMTLLGVKIDLIFY